ncbi:hypothetical protein ACQUY5_29715 [Bacillus cereus]|uniref:hypothetical protein n=1 Tax=Bacillus cereus TaxID=1396 RepID=UPI003D1847E8
MKFVYASKPCIVDGCTNSAHAKGYCDPHYKELVYKKDRTCKVERCNKSYHAKGFCTNHYYEQKVHNQNREKEVRLCSIEGCSSKHYGKGYCSKHYQYYNKRGLIE